MLLMLDSVAGLLKTAACCPSLIEDAITTTEVQSDYLHNHNLKDNYLTKQITPILGFSADLSIY